MGQGSQSGAESSEREAEDDLQEALDNLDDLQKKTAQQNRNEKLFQLEQELKKMLEAQQGILDRTKETDKQTVACAVKKGMVKMLYGDQQKLSDATRVVVKKLEDAPVFQWVLQTTSDDMGEAATRLDKEDSGGVTQEIEDDAIKKLADLVEALRKERTKPQQGGGGGGGGGGGKQPLVPPIAELKMLKIMQHDVNVKTKKIDDEAAQSAAEHADLNKDQRDRLRRAASKEGEIARITNKIAQDLNGAEEQAPPGDEPAGEKIKN